MPLRGQLAASFHNTLTPKMQVHKDKYIHTYHTIPYPGRSRHQRNPKQKIELQFVAGSCKTGWALAARALAPRRLREGAWDALVQHAKPAAPPAQPRCVMQWGPYWKTGCWRRTLFRRCGGTFESLLYSSLSLTPMPQQSVGRKVPPWT